MGLALSVLVHFLVLVVSPLVVRYLETFPAFPPAPPPRPSQVGMRVVEYRVTETSVPPEPREEEEEPRSEPEPTITGPAADAEEPVPTAAERLRPRVGDWRLWVLPPLTERDLTPAEREAELRGRLYADIEAYNDSVAAEAARAAEAMDWTVGEEGNRWGLSPGKIHLGPITLPLPINLGAHPAVQRELGAERAEWEAIRRQAGQGVLDEAFEERVKAIRERKEQEQAEQDSSSAR